MSKNILIDRHGYDFWVLINLETREYYRTITIVAPANGVAGLQVEMVKDPMEAHRFADEKGARESKSYLADLFWHSVKISDYELDEYPVVAPLVPAHIYGITDVNVDFDDLPDHNDD